MRDRVAELEKLKRKKWIDRRIAESLPIISSLSEEELKEIDLEELVKRLKLKLNKEIAKQLHRHQLI